MCVFGVEYTLPFGASLLVVYFLVEADASQLNVYRCYYHVVLTSSVSLPCGCRLWYALWVSFMNVDCLICCDNWQHNYHWMSFQIIFGQPVLFVHATLGVVSWRQPSTWWRSVVLIVMEIHHYIKLVGKFICMSIYKFHFLNKHSWCTKWLTGHNY